MAGKLRIEEAHRIAKSVANATRKKIGLRNNHLDAGKIERIYEELQSLPRNATAGLSHYDVPHHFVVSHLVENLRKKAGLTKREETWVRALLGRCWYNPPQREWTRRREAIERLEKLGARSGQLHAALKEEAAYLQEERRKFYSKNPDVGDDFANPIGRLWSDFHFEGLEDFTKLGEMFARIGRKMHESEAAYK